MHIPSTAGLTVLCLYEMEFASPIFSSLVAAPPPFNEKVPEAQGMSLPIFRRKRYYLSVA